MNNNCLECKHRSDYRKCTQCYDHNMFKLDKKVKHVLPVVKPVKKVVKMKTKRNYFGNIKDSKYGI